MGRAPVTSGAAQLSTAWPTRGKAIRGARTGPGTAPPVIGADGELAGEVPPMDDAVTVNRYTVPGTSPVTVQERAAVLHVLPPGAAVATYCAMAEPPVEAEAFHRTTAARLPATALTDNGELGAIAKELIAFTSPVPTELAGARGMGVARARIRAFSWDCVSCVSRCKINEATAAA